ncbi:hypothetical protein BJV74DRAFT_988733 [Russula compacta]|nr:hypothetical protein BJV74DRAFT_988733 [Russula compacta]
MSANIQVAGPSADNFTTIFNAASTEYQRVTGKRLDTHPFATQLDQCHSTEAVSNLLRSQAKAFSKFREGDEKLMKWLDPTVHILFTFSDTLGEGIVLPFSPAKTIFTGIGVLLGTVKAVVASHNMLMHLFERIHFFLQRLNSYTGIPLTNELTELLGKIMAQLLLILALSTKSMTERRIKKFLKRLVGRADVEDALSRLDMLTKEENQMAVARNLEVTHHVDGNVEATKGLVEDIDNNVKVIEGVTRRVDHNTKTTKDVTDELKWNQLQEKFQSWLSPPDPSLNHNTACKTQHDGTATWLIQGDTFRDWKKNGSLLWIRGNPGAGKSILCSAIVEDIKSMREATPALIAFYYFDYKDASKRHVHGLLTSLLFQLAYDSGPCWDVLYQLYTKCRDGSERPSDAALAKCLKIMLGLPGQLPIFVIMDALDECPSNTGTPSAREEVLDFVEDLVRSDHSNLFICITSRPEQDIQTALSPLTSPSCRVSLHEEDGQREDISNYVRSFVHKDRLMQRWREEDRELVITILSERANGMFRWVYCQLDTLRRCMPSSIRKALDELPTTLDDTYERVLQEIPKEKRQHAHRLFQCLIAAIRPLHVEELAEIFAIEFDADASPNLMEGWRPQHAEEAVLSACSTLIAVVEDNISKIVQFSHFSVKEFLISDRLRTSSVGNIRYYHILLDAAHTILARACVAVLLQLDEKVDKNRLRSFPLVFYAAQNWVDHARFEDVASRILDPIECLLDPSKPYLAAWTWIYDVDRGRSRGSIDDLPEHPPRPEVTALYYAVLCGLSGLAKHLIVARGEDVNVKCGYHGSPLHAASNKGHLDAVHLLLDHGADVNITTINSKKAPLCSAYDRGNLEVMRLLLEHGANADVEYDGYGLLLHDASYKGRAEVIRLLLRHKADVNAKSDEDRTPLHWASIYGHPKIVQLLLEYGADVNAISPFFGTPLHAASERERLEIVRILLAHKADVHIRRGGSKHTPFQLATMTGHADIAELLLEHGAEKE